MDCRMTRRSTTGGVSISAALKSDARCIRILLQESIKQIVGDYQVKAVELRSGKQVECDTVIISTGIKPNIDLARDARLSVGRGIRVNDQMQTNDAVIYAVGECAEHREHIYGLVAPGLEQAEVAAHTILGGQSRYEGSIAATRLKVVNMPVFSMGVVNEEDSSRELEEVIYENREQGIYRKLVLSRGHLVGAIATGDWNEQGRVQEVISKQRRLWPWQLLRFRRHGFLWPEVEVAAVTGWPAGGNGLSLYRGDPWSTQPGHEEWLWNINGDQVLYRSFIRLRQLRAAADGDVRQ